MKAKEPHRKSNRQPQRRSAPVEQRNMFIALHIFNESPGWPPLAGRRRLEFVPSESGCFHPEITPVMGCELVRGRQCFDFYVSFCVSPGRSPHGPFCGAFPWSNLLPAPCSGLSRWVDRCDQSPQGARHTGLGSDTAHLMTRDQPTCIRQGGGGLELWPEDTVGRIFDPDERRGSRKTWEWPVRCGSSKTTSRGTAAIETTWMHLFKRMSLCEGSLVVT